MPMYLDNIKSWVVYGCGLMIFKILAKFGSVKQVKFGVSWFFLENA